MAATGAVLWMVIFCLRTDWAAHWPLHHRGRMSIEEYLLLQGSLLIWAITLMQVTALTISATRQSGYVLDELERETARMTCSVLDPISPTNSTPLHPTRRNGSKLPGIRWSMIAGDDRLFIDRASVDHSADQREGSPSIECLQREFDLGRILVAEGDGGTGREQLAE